MMMLWFMILVHQTLRFWYHGYSLALFCRPHSFRVTAGKIHSRSEINQYLLWFTDLLYQFPVLSRQRAVLRVCHPDIAGALLERPSQYWVLGPVFFLCFFGIIFWLQSTNLLGTFDSVLGDGGAALTSLLTEAVDLLSTSQGRASVESFESFQCSPPRGILLVSCCLFIVL